jgi:hypothetical protein
MMHSRLPHNICPAARSAFTIMELIVSITIAVFMIFIFHGIFNEVTRAMRMGLHNSDVQHKSRTLDEQLAIETDTQISILRIEALAPPILDFAAGNSMVGPKGRVTDPDRAGGFLVIVNHEIRNIFRTADDRFDNNQETIRSDQLMFILDQGPGGTSEEPRMPVLAPSGRNTFGGNFTHSLESDYVRMWYGHVRQTRADGSQSAGDLGADVAGNPNALAVNWALGRHALFLRNVGTNIPLNSLQDIYAMDPQIVSSPLSGASPYANVNSPGLSATFLHMATTDVSEATLAGLTTGHGYLDGANSPTEYHNRMLGLGGWHLGLLFNNVRMQVNSNPSDTDLTSMDVARMHPHFMDHVSDFIVEFAHDYYTGTNPIQSAPPNPDGKIDMVQLNNNELDIRWYSGLPNNPGTSGWDEDYPVVYAPPPNDDAWTNNTGVAVGQYADGGAFVWGHAGSPVLAKWPWMIRIRYRLHDRSGKFVGRTIHETPPSTPIRERGHWFETILLVNRQP